MEKKTITTEIIELSDKELITLRESIEHLVIDNAIEHIQKLLLEAYNLGYNKGFHQGKLEANDF